MSCDCGGYLIADWLSGMVDFNVPDKTLKAILFNRGVESSDFAVSVSERDRQLCYADLLIWLTTTCQTSSGSLESDGGWQHQESAKTVTDRAGLRAKALAIYKKYGDAAADNVMTTSKVRMSNLY